MTKEEFFNKITLILEDFDQNREADMKYYLDDIYAASEIYYADIIKSERDKAVHDFLVEQLNRIS